MAVVGAECLMIGWKPQLWRAAVLGLAISLCLCGLLFLFGDQESHAANLVFLLQFPGYITCAALLPGSIESLNTSSYLGIAVPVNAAVYSAMIFAGVQLLRRKSP